MILIWCFIYKTYLNPNIELIFFKLIANHNQMMRMYTVAKLTKIVKLDLSDNHLMSIEGLRDLSNLTWLNLSNNKIKVSFART